MDIFAWIDKNLNPLPSTTEVLIYNDMESQSGCSLPIIYTEFDAGSSIHWGERGAIYDFLFAVRGEDKQLLDFGPGDGWPSLLLAPMAAKVTGLDSSKKRVEVCRENARRLGLSNTAFVSYVAGDALPFTDNTFDGITAASSVEQSPDPRAVLKEFYRVLRPGGRLRLSYEGLARYRGGREQQLELLKGDAGQTKMLLYNRNISREYVDNYALKLSLAPAELVKLVPEEDIRLLNSTLLGQLQPYITFAGKCRTTHPSCGTWLNWLVEAGFSQAVATHSGKEAAKALYRHHAGTGGPEDLAGVDFLVAPVARAAVELAAPPQTDPPITAVK